MPDPTPWLAEGRWPTATELERHIAALRPTERVVFLDALLTQAQAGATCDEHLHTDRLTYAEEVSRRLGRYRTAWQSARRRARELTAAVDSVIDDLPISLILDETTSTVRWDHPDANPMTDLRTASGAPPDTRPLDNLITAIGTHEANLYFARTLPGDTTVSACSRYPDGEFVHVGAPCTATP